MTIKDRPIEQGSLRPVIPILPDSEDALPVSIISEINSPLPVVDLNGTAIAKGDIAGYSNEQKFGINMAVGTSRETIWTEGGRYTFPSSATIMTVSSSDVNDDVGDVGARTVEIFGLDTDYLEINEIITLDGRNPVNTINSYLRIHRAIIRTAGATGWNEGTIYVGTGAVVTGIPANIFTTIAPTRNQTLQTLFTVPAGKTAYITQWYITVGQGKELEAELLVRPLNEVFQVKQSYNLFQIPFKINFHVPLEVLEKSDIEVVGTVDATTSKVSSSFELILIEN